MGRVQYMQLWPHPISKYEKSVPLFKIRIVQAGMCVLEEIEGQWIKCIWERLIIYNANTEVILMSAFLHTVDTI